MKLEKITRPAGVSRERVYDDACGTAHALELVGERWALLIVRELMLGPRRFGDLRGDLPGLSANVLTQRLEKLEAAGVLRRRRLPPPARVQVYELTPWGYEAEETIKTLGRWAARSPAHDPTLPLSPVSLMLSFRTMFDPARAGDIAVRLEMRFGEDVFGVVVEEGRLTTERGPLDDAEAVLSGDPSAVAGVVYVDQPIDAMEAAGVLTVSGDRRAIGRFAGIFQLPEKAG